MNPKIKTAALVILLLVFFSTFCCREIQFKFIEYQWGQIEKQTVKESMQEFNKQAYSGEILRKADLIDDLVTYMNRNQTVIKKELKKNEISGFFTVDSLNQKLDSLEHFVNRITPIEIDYIIARLPTTSAKNKKILQLQLKVDTGPRTWSCSCETRHIIYSNSEYFTNLSIKSPTHTLMKGIKMNDNLDYIITTIPNTL